MDPDEEIKELEGRLFVPALLVMLLTVGGACGLVWALVRAACSAWADMLSHYR